MSTSAIKSTQIAVKDVTAVIFVPHDPGSVQVVPGKDTYTSLEVT